MSIATGVGGWLVVCALAVIPARALAEPERPWAAGVAETEQETALALYVEGNREFTESRFAQALAKYKEAIQHWDHPAIRYNMAVCLINLDQPVEARDNLERGLVFGAAPLGAAEYAQGLTYRKLLDAQLIHVKIACREPGTEITLDGKALMTGPGAADTFLLPGTHQLVATKRGFLTTSRTFSHVAGAHATIDIEPATEPTLSTRAVRRWATWKPWAIAAGGLAVAGLGGVVYWRASENFAVYDRGIAAHCSRGCDEATLAGMTRLLHTKDVAGAEQVVATSLFVVGGAAVIAGVVGLVMNQPRLQLKPAPAVAWVPGGATLSLRWAL